MHVYMIHAVRPEVFARLLAPWGNTTSAKLLADPWPFIQTARVKCVIVQGGFLIRFEYRLHTYGKIDTLNVRSAIIPKMFLEFSFCSIWSQGDIGGWGWLHDGRDSPCTTKRTSQRRWVSHTTCASSRVYESKGEKGEAHARVTVSPIWCYFALGGNFKHAPQQYLRYWSDVGGKNSDEIKSPDQSLSFPE